MQLQGMWNIRDLAGLGGLAQGALLRSDSPHRLNAASWDVIARLGVGTVIDLRTSAEAAEVPAEGPLRRVHVPLEDGVQQSPVMAAWFEDGRIATPLYYAPFTETWPERVSDALTAIATAEGGVLVHCAAGRDRTGMIVALVLEALDTPREAIVTDFLRSATNLASPVARALKIPDHNEIIHAVVTRAGTTLEDSLNDYLDGATDFLAPHRPSLRRKFLEMG